MAQITSVLTSVGMNIYESEQKRMIQHLQTQQTEEEMEEEQQQKQARDEELAKELATLVVISIAAPDRPPSHVSESNAHVVEAVKKISDENESLFNEMPKLLGLNDTADCFNRELLEGVIESLMKDGCNWGRVLMTFAFIGRMAREQLRHREASTVEEQDQECDLMGSLASSIIAQKIVPWITQNGGWDELARISSNEASSTSWSSSAFWTFLGLGWLTVSAILKFR